jgi:nitrate reductase gamma subunit
LAIQYAGFDFEFEWRDVVDTLYYLILVPMVYAAVAIFAIGLFYQIIKILRRPKFAPPLLIYPQKKPGWLFALHDLFLMPGVRRQKPVLWGFLMVFHLCLFLLLLGHLELIKDFGFLQLINHEIFLGGGWVGILLLVSVLYFFSRRLVSPTKDLSVFEDYFILLLLLLTVLFGSEMDWARRWYYYGEMGVDAYRTYLSSLFAFAPDISEVTSPGHSIMLVLHVFCANLFIMLFPFSKLMHAIMTFPVNVMRRG